MSEEKLANKQAFIIVASVLLFEDDDIWVAQCLEYDIVAQGATVDLARRSFEKTFVGQIILDVVHKKAPLQGIDKAPKFFWDKFDDAKQRHSGRKPIYLPYLVPPAVKASVDEYILES